MTCTSRLFSMLSTSSYVFILGVILTLSSCASTQEAPKSSELVKSGRAIHLQQSASLINSRQSDFYINGKGEVLIRKKQTMKSETEDWFRMSKPQNKEFWDAVDSLKLQEYENEYQVANDTQVTTIEFYEKGSLVKSIRYSSGAPQVIRSLVQQILNLDEQP